MSHYKFTLLLIVWAKFLDFYARSAIGGCGDAFLRIGARRKIQLDYILGFPLYWLLNSFVIGLLEETI